MLSATLRLVAAISLAPVTASDHLFAVSAKLVAAFIVTLEDRVVE
jgi:hypothetical protein